MVRGVYAITNTLTGEQYIGQSVNLAARLNQHRDFMRRGRHPNARIQASIALHGADVFSFEMFEVCDDDTGTRYLLDREQYYIHTLRPALNHPSKATYDPLVLVGVGVPCSLLGALDEVSGGRRGEYLRALLRYHIEHDGLPELQPDHRRPPRPKTKTAPPGQDAPHAG